MKRTNKNPIQISFAACREIYEMVFNEKIPGDLPYESAALMARDHIDNDDEFNQIALGINGRIQLEARHEQILRQGGTGKIEAFRDVDGDRHIGSFVNWVDYAAHREAHGWIAFQPGIDAHVDAYNAVDSYDAR